MIGVFDSWMWWRHTLTYLQKQLPDNDFLYLWDTKNLPYGSKDEVFLRERTFECLEWMFAQWCSLVILACNTASAYAIRPRQERYPDRKVLSVTVPWIEKMIKQWAKNPVLFATEATIRSEIYSQVLHRLYPTSTISFIPLIGKWVVDRIERWLPTYELIQQIFSTIRNEDYDTVILWCTHYPLVASQIQEIVWKRVSLIDPGLESSLQLPLYLSRHKEIIVTTNGGTQYYCTWEWANQLVHVDL